jgi:putative oxidoreductase
MPSATAANTVSRLNTTKWADATDFAGRVALAAIFVMSGAAKLFGYTAETVQLMESYHVPLAGVLVYPAGLVELLAGIALAVGYHATSAALVLALYTVVVTPIFHAFWAVAPDQAMFQMLFFTKNLAIFGGLLYVAAHGSGRFALKRG